jgi:hypothetical protein
MQGFMPADFPAREIFCHVRRRAEHFFVSSAHFTDEARFDRDGIINIHNQHQWSEDNLHSVIHSIHQQQFSINVWTGIVSDFLVGSRVLPQATGRWTTEN